MIIIFNQDITTFLDCAFCIEMGNLLNPQEVIENLLTAQLMNQRVQRVMPGFFYTHFESFNKKQVTLYNTMMILLGLQK